MRYHLSQGQARQEMVSTRLHINPVSHGPGPWCEVHGLPVCGSHLCQSAMASEMFPDMPRVAEKMEPLVFPSKWYPSSNVIMKLGCLFQSP